MSRAFVLEPSDYSVHKAERYGEVVWLFGDKDEHVSPLHSRFGAQIARRLEEHRFDPDHDYLVATGSMITVATLIATAVAEFGELRVLWFHADERVRDYVVVTMGEQSLASKGA